MILTTKTQITINQKAIDALMEINTLQTKEQHLNSLCQIDCALSNYFKEENDDQFAACKLIELFKDVII